MKVLLRMLTIALLAMVMTIVACSTPPPPVSRDELQSARNEAIEAEELAESSTQERRDLENELARKEAELRSLRDYERQLGF